MNWGTPKQTNEGAPNLLRLDPDVFVPVVADGIDRVVEGFERGVVVAGDFDSGTEVLGEVCAEEAAEAVHGVFFAVDEDGVAAVDDFEDDEFGGGGGAVTVAFAGLLAGFGGGLTAFFIAVASAGFLTISHARAGFFAVAGPRLLEATFAITHAGLLGSAFAVAGSGFLEVFAGV